MLRMLPNAFHLPHSWRKSAQLAHASHAFTRINAYTRDPFPLLSHLTYDCMKALQSLFPSGALPDVLEVEFRFFLPGSLQQRGFTTDKKELFGFLSSFSLLTLSAGGTRPVSNNVVK